MSKYRGKGEGGAPQPAKSKEQPGEGAPLKHRALESGLKQLRETMRAEEEAKARAAARAEEEARRKAEALGIAHKPAKPWKPASPAPVVAKKPTVDVWRPDLDKELFRVAMAGVKPLSERGGAGRVREPSRAAGAGAGTKLRRAQAEGGESIPVRWREDGTCEGARRGREFALEALGRFAVPQETLDLHGLDPAEARTRVEEFVRTRRARGMRVVRVVHGQGRHAPDGGSLLRDAVVKALSEPPGAREVDAFQSAEPLHGGSGAILVALRA